ncbi:MAG: biotin--[acetyl-CoA-carboxylase] ligase [Paludibacter sp.]|nr:biotin--[acetyl-CoA-carboxylase] ligase [Bacteroidales bacterium]MCM1068606.1 biotin--[acetyl-CoA-carboxylase] ligase [Prevotella sp.]MCM1353270.1 biotin--[acetyl-CoA-carboxylase] ligase [Bacteroides sp.]MCM1442322.1 biotin--[acetyl-CoA-carboxylase] ligase [Muribaculum sp.]MCM1481141.1 biotin--[acetyl-CoA-carboxylase] ligase [Paludibacter sp.]
MYINQTNSTSSYLKELLETRGESLSEGFTIHTDFQTAGRGQAGNSWESEAGKNLLFSTLFRVHDIAVQKQFLLLELVTLSLCNVLGRYTDGICIKWPNDIYWHDRKLVGILIEHSIMNGRLEYSIAGIGINVNQETFKSAAPNPISLKQITGKTYDREQLLREILTEFKELRPLLQQPQRLKKLYMNHLYRREGWYPYIENICSTAPIEIAQGTIANTFEARIRDVENNGCIVLEDKNGKIRHYHFKEVRYVLPYLAVCHNHR